MWSIARFDLKLSSEEFYILSPRHMDALLKRKEAAEQMSEFMLGQIAATIANFSMAAPKKPLRATDFMPSHAVTQPKSKRKSRKAIARKLNAIFGVTHT